MQIEIWKDIPGYENLYQVSNIGRIKSLERFIIRGNNGWNCKESILTNKLDGKGYHFISLSKNGYKRQFSIHKLVLMAFTGYVGGCGYCNVIDHINNIKTDNRLENLQIITQRENTSKDKFRIKTTSKYIGVYWNKHARQWDARIHINKQKIHIGYFKNEYDAHLAYQKKLNEINSYV